MAARGHAKDDRDPMANRQELTVSLAGLPSPAQVTLDLSRGARSALSPNRVSSFLGIEAGVGSGATVSALRVQPQRIEIELSAAPSVLTLALQVACDGPFVFGWLQVSEEVRSRVATSVERLNIVGPGYWAVPVWEPAPPPAFPSRAEDLPGITHQRQTARLGQVPATEVAETVKPKEGRT